MPRILPWERRTATTQARPRKAVKASTSLAKIAKTRTSASPDIEDESNSESLRRKQVTSSSPVPSPPEEEYMKDGLENDDMYRMVEDEFLAVAQKFTVHLHAAEYKRYQREVQSRNAQTIRSIIRPSVGGMPLETKRRLEGAERAENQKRLLDDMLGRKQNARSEDDSDGREDLPYAGTMLHNLMDSPRKRARKLSTIVSKTTISRAAAGYSQPAAISQEKSYEPPQPIAARQPKLWSSDEILNSSYDDDDLDAPISAPPFASKYLSSTTNSKATDNNQNLRMERSIPRMPTERVASTLVSGDTPMSEIKPGPLPVDSPPKLSRERPKVSRFQRAQDQKKREEMERIKVKERSKDIIPTFL